MENIELTEKDFILIIFIVNNFFSLIIFFLFVKKSSLLFLYKTRYLVIFFNAGYNLK